MTFDVFKTVVGLSRLGRRSILKFILTDQIKEKIMRKKLAAIQKSYCLKPTLQHIYIFNLEKFD